MNDADFVRTSLSERMVGARRLLRGAAASVFSGKETEGKRDGKRGAGKRLRKKARKSEGEKGWTVAVGEVEDRTVADRAIADRAVEDGTAADRSGRAGG